MPRRWLRRVRPAVDCLDAHLLHQRRNVQTPHIGASPFQQSLQHPAAGEGIVEVQLVDPAHQRKIGGRRRPRQVVDAAPADPEHLSLAGDWQIMAAVDHRFALGNSPALPSAPDKILFSSVSSPIFACSDFTSIAGAVASDFSGPPNTSLAPFRS